MYNINLDEFVVKLIFNSLTNVQVNYKLKPSKSLSNLKDQLHIKLNLFSCKTNLLKMFSPII